jgi:hypothetical protein
VLRVSLIAYLLVATMAGPAWCCCTLGKVIAYALPAAVEADMPAAECCCCVKKPVEQDTSRKSPTEKQDRHEPCPCKETRDAQASYYVAPERGGLADGDALPDVFAGVGVFAFELVATDDSLVSLAHDPGPPPRSGQDILLAKQSFRC